MKLFSGISRKTAVVVLLDLMILAFVDVLALLIRFEYSFDAVPTDYVSEMAQFLILQVVITEIIFWWRRMYHFVWRAVSAHDVAEMILTSSFAYAVTVVIGLVFGIRLPISVYFVSMICLVAIQTGMRCFLRFYCILFHQGKVAGQERIMLIGGGDAGRMLITEMESSRYVDGRICCIIDDNSRKWGKKLSGIPIVGGRDVIIPMVEQFEITHIFFAIPSASPEQKRDILDICKQTKCRVQTLPGLYQLVNGTVSVAAMKDVEIEDLLGREPVQLNTPLVEGFLRDKVAMVTGGGGSIGSELCRQIARFKPSRLIVVDCYENNAYDIQQELIRKYHAALDLVVEIASVRDKQRIYQLVEKYRPDVIFHAAAHKHVPLMEMAPAEAIKNNIFGTYHVVRAAEKYGVGKFVLISTDKAVNPTNFMGATKRFCEMILQSRGESRTEFCAVRFGNVLGSNGSVVPLFKDQIAAGGPVTITDKRIIRYFMTIPEAAQLVLEAGAMARQNQVFVLDMGEPVKILDLARNLIQLSGFEPYEDIDIVEIGLRPGEKLYEELLMKSEHLLKTPNRKIFIEEQGDIDADKIMNGLVRLDEAVTAGESAQTLIDLLKTLVPTYHSPEEVNSAAEKLYCEA